MKPKPTKPLEGDKTMKRTKRLMATMILAAMATLSTAQAFAAPSNGKDGIMLGDRSRTGIMLGDRNRTGIMLGDRNRAGIMLGDRSRTGIMLGD
jgi:hypothetical protein